MAARRTVATVNLRERSLFDECDAEVRVLVLRYVERLHLPLENLRVTTDRAEFGSWLGRRVPAAYGGAYVYLRQVGIHAVLINLQRIDLDAPHALEVVVAEELVHMRDHLDGDHRRHSHHGHDRIAHRVSALTGASLEDIRSALLPVRRQPYRYIYACPRCHVRVPRKRKGTWSCGRCSSAFDSSLILRIVEEVPASGE